MRPALPSRSLFSTVTPRKIPDVVFQQVVALISSGRLKPGARLPSERDMAADLGVSRQSVREAIHKARTMGLIEVRQGGGAVVVSSVAGQLKPPMAIILEQQAGKIFDFLEIRKLFEAWCAERAAADAKAADLRRLKVPLDVMAGLEPGQEKWEQADLRFHAALAEASHNLIAVHIMEGLRASFADYFKAKKLVLGAERKDRLHRQHTEIYEAVRRRDPPAARERILAHLEYVEEMIRRDFRSAQVMRRRTAKPKGAK